MGTYIADIFLDAIKESIPIAVIPTIKALLPFMIPSVMFFIAKKILWKIRTNRFL